MRAFELGVEYAQMRTTFGKPIIEHQAGSFRLADMSTKVEAAHQMMIMAARLKDSGERNDFESGMAKYLASECCNEVVEDSFRIHGGYRYSKEGEIERLYREAQMLMIGEGSIPTLIPVVRRSPPSFDCQKDRALLPELPSNPRELSQQQVYRPKLRVSG